MLARPSTQTRFSSVRCSAKKSGDAKASWAKKLAEPAPTGFNVDSSKKSAKKVVEEEEPAMPITDFKSDIPKDLWEDESFDLLGKAGTYIVPIIAVAAIAVGGFAASRYNDGATQFLQTATSDEDTAKVIFIEDLQKK